MKKLLLTLLVIIMVVTTMLACKQNLPDDSSEQSTNSSYTSENSSVNYNSSSSSSSSETWNENSSSEMGNENSSSSSSENEGGNTGEENEVRLLATFEFGEKTSSGHQDGDPISEGSSYKHGSYTITLTDITKLFESYDALGNACLKLGSSSASGSFKFTVPSDVNAVVISAACYKNNKDNNSNLVINGNTYTMNGNSDDGAYTAFAIDTSTLKTVSVSSGKRAMIDSVAYYSGMPDDLNQGGDLGGGNGEEVDSYIYTDFSASDKEQLTDLFGEVVIPFIANNEYYLEGYSYDYADEGLTELGFNFYTFGNTSAEFSAYREKFSSFTFVESYEDEYGDTWYCYDKDDIYVDMSYYFDGEGYVVDVYVYYLIEMGGGSGGSGENQDSFAYTDFSASDKSLFISVFGEVVIPFIANNDYALEEYSYYYEDEDLTETGLNFYTYGNTSVEFSAYREKFSSFTFAESYEDEYGDTWYCYDKGDIYVDMAHYNTEEGYVVDVYVYYLTEGDTSGGGSGGNEGGSGSDENASLITNAGSGLPAGENGVYNVDFTKAKYVKNVTEQGYYLDGCPTTSVNAKPSVLVVPVDFSDAPAGVNYPIEKLEKVFNGTVGETDYYSVHDYYFTSSYGKLDVDFTVLNYWFRAEKSSTYYKNFTTDYYGDNIAAGDMLLIDEILKALEPSMDLTKFDSDNNSVIDAIIIVNSLEINADEDMHWAYRAWNLYGDEQGNYYEYDGVSVNDYMWLSYNFMYETYDEEGNVEFTDKTVCNPYTFIHEFGHVLGADDYYDIEGVNDPLSGCDVMDAMCGDHNPYSKFNYGWLTTSTLITAKESVTLTLNPFTTTGETIIIANNWNDDLGLYQEYYVIAYYTAEGLNGGNAGYFAREGVVVYHVNASLYKNEYDGEVYYDVYNNNTDASNEYGTEDNLIEYLLSTNETFTYVAGDMISSNTCDDQGNKIAYVFEVLSIEDGKAVIEFTKNN